MTTRRVGDVVARRTFQRRQLGALSVFTSTLSRLTLIGFKHQRFGGVEKLKVESMIQ